MKTKMTIVRSRFFCLLTGAMLAAGTLSHEASSAQATIAPAKLEALKKELMTEIDKQKKSTQVMVDMVFSFGELGFQEVETSKYLTDIMTKNGFKVKMGIAGIPTAWT